MSGATPPTPTGSGVFPLAETHGIALWPSNRLVAHSDGLGWHNVYASLAAERSWAASLDPVSHISIAYCMHRPAKVRRVIEGEGRVDEAVLTPRTFGVVPADRVSRWRLEGAPDILLIYLRRAMVSRLAEEIFDFDPAGIEIEAMLGVADPLLEQLSLALLAALGDRGPGDSGLYADSIAEAAAIRLLRHHATGGRGSPAPAREALPRSAIRRVCDYIEGALDADLSLESLAREAGVSPHAFPRLFRQATDETPHQFVLNRRLAGAKELLRATDMPVVEIALATGFSSQSHLSSAFRRLTGTTPAAYRRNGAM